MLSISTAADEAYYLAPTRVLSADGPEAAPVLFDPKGATGLKHLQQLDELQFRRLHRGRDARGYPLAPVCAQDIQGPLGSPEFQEDEAAARALVRTLNLTDFTFSPDKSVSAIFAFAQTDQWSDGPLDIRLSILAAGQAAVVRTMTFAQMFAVGRCRTNGHDVALQLPLVAAICQQGDARPTQRTDGTSDLRPGAPQLHWQTVVQGYVRDRFGVVRSLDQTVLRSAQWALRAFFHAALADELKGRLGIGVQIDREKTAAVIPGFSPGLLAFLSPRRRAVVERRAELLKKNPKLDWAVADQIAVVGTRKAKEVRVGDRHANWRTETIAAGFDPDAEVEAVLSMLEPPSSAPAARRAKLEVKLAIRSAIRASDGAVRLQTLYRDAIEIGMGALSPEAIVAEVDRMIWAKGLRKTVIHRNATIMACRPAMVPKACRPLIDDGLRAARESKAALEAGLGDVREAADAVEAERDKLALVRGRPGRIVERLVEAVVAARARVAEVEMAAAIAVLSAPAVESDAVLEAVPETAPVTVPKAEDLPLKSPEKVIVAAALPEREKKKPKVFTREMAEAYGRIGSVDWIKSRQPPTAQPKPDTDEQEPVIQ